jgi:hypothetical protein
MGNPMCPEEGCKRIMVVKELTHCLGISEITGKKQYGLSKYYVCPVHKHQRFKVGAEVILRKPILPEESKLTVQGSEVKQPKSQRQMRYRIPRRIRRQIIREQTKRKEEQ